MKLLANLVFTLGLVALLLLWGSQRPSEVYGPRHSLHKTVRECTRCHAPWQSVGNPTCTGGVCHASLAEGARRRTPGERFHEAVAARTCRGCHPEHKGPAGKARFDHGLVPNRVAARCQDCHPRPAKLRTGAEHPPDRTEGCVACHTSDTDWKRVVTPREP